MFFGRVAIFASTSTSILSIYSLYTQKITGIIKNILKFYDSIQGKD